MTINCQDNENDNDKFSFVIFIEKFHIPIYLHTQFVDKLAQNLKGRNIFKNLLFQSFSL